MEKEKVICQECKGSGIIGNSVCPNDNSGYKYDCDICHGNGYIILFNGNGKIII